MGAEGSDRSGQRDREPTPDPFACRLVTVLLVLGVAVWLVIVYLLTRGW